MPKSLNRTRGGPQPQVAGPEAEQPDVLRRNRRHESLVAYLFVAPALLSFLLFMGLPIVLTVTLSLFSWSGISLSTLSFVGFGNYAEMSGDPVFFEALGNNLLFLCLGMTSITALGLFLAVLLERSLPGSNFFRGVFFIPTVISTVIVGIVFKLILSPEFGLLRPMFAAIGIDFTTALLGDPDTALFTIIAVETWRSFGFAMFLFVAGLKGLDESLVEAAQLDGASDRQTFWFVVFPQLRPVTLLVLTLVGIDMLKLFDLIYVMTGGGPQKASEVLASFMYGEAFKFNEVGYGSAIATVILMITFFLTVVRFKLLPDSLEEDTRR